MANGVGELARLNRTQLVSLEEMSYRAGIEPGPDLAFAGVRTAIERASAAEIFLRGLVPFETELMAWLATRRVLAAEREPAAATASTV